jgi:hypothetical protein
MCRYFTIPKILRMTPKHLLQQFFERLGHRLLSLDWRKLKERSVESILFSIGLLPSHAQEQIELVLASVFELACDSGWQAILEVARLEGQTRALLDLPDDTSPYERSMWTWLFQPELFEQAHLIHQVEGLTRWRKRTGLPQITPRVTPAAVHELATALSQCLKHEEGRGHECTVEYFRRRDAADVFVAYPDDFVQRVTMHDGDGQLVPRALRQTFEIVFAYLLQSQLPSRRFQRNVTFPLSVAKRASALRPFNRSWNQCEIFQLPPLGLSS